MFEKMPPVEIRKSLQSCFNNGIRGLIITLTDGTSFCGCISNIHFSSEGIENIKLYHFTNKEIVFVDTRPSVDNEYYIPFEQIAALACFDFSQEIYAIEEPSNRFRDIPVSSKEPVSFEPITINDLYTRYLEDHTSAPTTKIKTMTEWISEGDAEETRLLEREAEITRKLEKDGKYHNTKHIENYILDEMALVCRSKGFRCVHHIVLYAMRWHRRYIFGEVKSKTSFPMYADWDYIGHVAGGVNSIGVGIPFVSASTSWQLSLYSIRKNLMKKKSRAISSINEGDSGAVVIIAYLDFIHVTAKKKRIVIPRENMEGDEWIPVILSKEPICDINNLKIGEYCIGFMKEKNMLVPKEVFNATRTPLLIQGEIMPTSLDTPFGNTRFAIKIRNISSK